MGISFALFFLLHASYATAAVQYYNISNETGWKTGVNFTWTNASVIPNEGRLELGENFTGGNCPDSTGYWTISSPTKWNNTVFCNEVTISSTLTVPPFDGKWGGNITINANKIIITTTGKINASEAGFAGGALGAKGTGGGSGVDNCGGVATACGGAGGGAGGAGSGAGAGGAGNNGASGANGANGNGGGGGGGTGSAGHGAAGITGGVGGGGGGGTAGGTAGAAGSAQGSQTDDTVILGSGAGGGSG
ncbi:MAG: hypothetical protein HY366_00995, partial [Candidatus Aenigmarchaeota archaeon]|nr:hypothetical protein [Candidatus Aenigmarchaeota archaeon]